VSFQTERLEFRPFVSDDAAAAFKWFSDPDVMRFIPDAFGPDRTIQATRERLERYLAYEQRDGFSSWIILLRESGDAIGDAGLTMWPDGREIDLSFRLAKAYWGRKFGAEVAAAWTQRAFDHYGLQQLTAAVHAANRASLQILKNLGFREARREEIGGMPVIIHQLDSPYFR
jgi:ribosomal-protein-alanine N-acetyltransferase